MAFSLCAKNVPLLNNFFFCGEIQSFQLEYKQLEILCEGDRFYHAGFAKDSSWLSLFASLTNRNVLSLKEKIVNFCPQNLQM